MGPDFLCIGAQKSGTTWLHDNLSRHPDVWLPPIKEIHYFDRPYDSIPARLFGTSSRLKRARHHLRTVLLDYAQGHTAAHEVRWAFRYCLATRSDAWYCSLFDERGEAVTGEICPGYARLPIDRVQRVGELMPNGRIIYLLRHPVERAWSAAAMHFNDSAAGGIAAADPREVENWLRRSKTLEHGVYSEAILRWRGVFGERLMVGFYDELRADPAALLARIQSFLGLRAAIPVDAGHRRNAGNYMQVPVRFVTLLERVFAEELRRLHDLLDHPITSEWLRRRYGAEEALQRAGD
jgi:hypothetical protein